MDTTREELSVDTTREELSVDITREELSVDITQEELSLDMSPIAYDLELMEDFDPEKMQAALNLYALHKRTPIESVLDGKTEHTMTQRIAYKDASSLSSSWDSTTTNVC